MWRPLIIGLVVVMAICAVAFFFFGIKTPMPVSRGTPGLPVATSTQQPIQTGPEGVTEPTSTTTVPARGTNQSITVADFIKNGTTYPDPSNPGNYYLAGTAMSDYAISYDSKTQSFTIALDKEPLGAARTAAEQFLLSALGVSQAQLCSIRYYLGTDVHVNALYAGKNLGFSFCPGATPLP